MQHRLIGEAGYRRGFQYNETNNRLLSSGIGQEANWQNYHYDLAGNMQELAHLDLLKWNAKNEIQEIQKGDLSAYYQYDAAGERARKIVKKGNNKLEVRYYLGEVEIYREYNNGILTLERESLHIQDDTQRIALVDTQTIKEGNEIALADRSPLRRYQLGNHLGSASIELDELAKVISVYLHLTQFHHKNHQ